MNESQLLDLYYTMFLARKFEEKIEALFGNNEIRGTTHLSTGQEAVAAGACSAIKKDDYVTSNHRGHSHAIAKGLDMPSLLAEIMGKETGFCKGRGGTQHVGSQSCGFYSNGITGGMIPVATGLSLASKMKGDGKVTLCFFGDGATNQGVFHESLNIASLWKLPIIYICENNLYAMSTPIKNSIAIGNVCERAKAYAMPSFQIDGNDCLLVRDEVEKAVNRARDGNGPTFIECLTYRHCGHSKNDLNIYRSKEEEKAWMERCPLRKFRTYCLESGCSEPAIVRKEEEAINRIEKAYNFALSSPYPDSGMLYDDVYA
jgi:TPP-dependent pyruvate/acetoin dehydrogenase alpha subunit